MGSHDTSSVIAGNTYPGSGYEFVFKSSNITDTATSMKSLRRQGWTDLSTRAVFVEMNLYNPTIDRYSIINMMFEMPLHGGVVASTTYTNVRLFKYTNGLDYVVLFFEIFMMLQLLEFIKLQVGRVKLVGPKEYFTDPWSVFDMINSGSLWVVIQFRVQWLVMVGSTVFSTTEMIDLRGIADLIYLENDLNSLNALLIYIRAYKFLALWPRLQKYQDTLTLSVPAIMMYWVNIGVIFFAFAMTGFVAFGTKIKQFHTPGESMIMMFTYASGQYNFDELKAVDPFLGPALSILFMCIVYFCLTCMFMAINCYTYNMVIRGLHLSNDNQSLSGPDLMAVTTTKIQAWLEEKIPSLREARIEQEAEQRREERRAGNRNTTEEEQEQLLQRIHNLIDICGPQETFAGLGKFEFYNVTIKMKEKFTLNLPLFELNDITKAISQVVLLSQTDNEGAADLIEKTDEQKELEAAERRAGREFGTSKVAVSAAAAAAGIEYNDTDK